VAKLKAENARLVALLDAHGIDWRLPAEPVRIEVVQAEHTQQFDTEAKLALFRSLFRGRTDVYPIRWESKAGKSGYTPACANEWKPGVCEKPRIKCGDCGNRQLLPLTDEVVYRHLAGEVIIGIYPLLPDDTCYLLAVDFDEAEWRDDARAFAQSCHELNVPMALEISRSGKGAHCWIFFKQSVPAHDARRLGAAIISHACERTRQLALTSYDRLFPNQDYMPKGGFGNLIALPLVGKGVVGTIGGGKAKPTGIIDIAVMQSLSRKGEISDHVKNYGQIIVDECHHLSAVSFEALLRTTTARYVLGLTATPVRRDGQQPIIFMQCGPIRHSAARPASAPHDLSVVPRLLPKPVVVPDGSGIQDVFRKLASDSERTAKIVSEIELAYSQGRKILVLTERTEHVDTLELELKQRVNNLFTLHGRMPKKQRIARMHELECLAPDAPRVLLATGKLVGEGFDHPPLDTLVLAMPISWKGILQQYAGRLHRSHADKADVRVIDFVDEGSAALMRMWDKRQAGYKAMGYRMTDPLITMDLL